MEEYRFMTWGQVKDSAKGKITIGANTVSHPFLTNLTDHEIKDEIVKSKKKLEKKLSIEIKCFCYPSGDKNRYIEEIVKKTGFLCACSTNPGFIT